MTSSKDTISKTLQFLECSVKQGNYLIDCAHVREVIRLPALTEITEGPNYLAGLLNLRGEIIEVLDAATLLGRSVSHYELTDKVIVLGKGGVSRGLLVQNTRHVRTVASARIESRTDGCSLTEGVLVDSVAHTDDGLVLVLNSALLLEDELQADKSNSHTQGFLERSREEDRAEFQARADALRVKSVAQEGSSHAYAIIELHGEFYGIGLEQVTEFLELSGITPVPCCPPHIVGNANWRGDVLTIIDVSSALELGEVERRDRWKVVVFGQKRDAVGVAVDKIYDVCHLHDSQIISPPTTLRATTEGYLTGVAEHHAQKLGILCIDTLLGRDDWCVREVV